MNMIKPKPAKSLGHALARGAARAAMITGAFAAGFVVMGGGGMEYATTPEQAAPVVERPMAKGSPEWIIAKRCAAYDKATIPGHAVVALPGQDPAYVESSVGFDLWGPDQQYGTADDLPGTLYAFCQ